MRPQFSYSMNCYLGSGQPDGPKYKGDVVKLADIERSPFQVAFFGEESLWRIKREDGSYLNGAYFNDNVLLVSATIPTNNTAPIPYADCLGSFHKTNDPGRNFGSANVVFVDGHVDLVEPVDAFNATWVKRGNWTVSP